MVAMHFRPTFIILLLIYFEEYKFLPIELNIVAPIHRQNIAALVKGMSQWWTSRVNRWRLSLLMQNW